MKKREKKLLKLLSKAQDCTSREKAIKIIKKADKTRKKMAKMSEEI